LRQSVLSYYLEIVMIEMASQETVAQSLGSERAILALHAEWSVPSARALQALERWEREWLHQRKALVVTIYVARTMPEDYLPAVVEWLNAQGLAHLITFGSGEVFWLERGLIIAKLICNVDGDSLTRQTLQVWG
jgi:hypothetical protein